MLNADNDMNDEIFNSPTEIRSNYLTNYSVNPQVSEKQFDEFTSLIANLCGAPKAVITLIDGRKLWYKSGFGTKNGCVLLRKSYCQFTLANKALTEISDVDSDARLIDQEWKNEYPLIKSYAGVPLVTSDGVIGTLCIMDSVARKFTDRQREMLLELGKMVSSLMESRRTKQVLNDDLQKSTDHPMVSLRAMRSITRSW